MKTYKQKLETARTELQIWEALKVHHRDIVGQRASRRRHLQSAQALHFIGAINQALLTAWDGWLYFHQQAHNHRSVDGPTPHASIALGARNAYGSMLKVLLGVNPEQDLISTIDKLSNRLGVHLVSRKSLLEEV